MANIALGKIKFQFKGKYDNSTSYSKDDVVVFDHLKFIRIGGTGSGQAPLIVDTRWEYTFNKTLDSDGAGDKLKLNKDYWDFFEGETAFSEYKGTWLEDTTYYIGDVVTGSSGACYYAIRRTINDDPVLNLYGSWELLIEGGFIDHTRKVCRLMTSQPIGWRGHPKYPITAGWTWNGNVPSGLSEFASKEEFNDYGQLQREIGGLAAIDWWGAAIVHGGIAGYNSGPNWSSGVTGGASDHPSEFGHTYRQWWNTVMRSNPFYSGPDKGKLLSDTDKYSLPVINDPYQYPLYNGAPRVISIVNNHDVTCLMSDGTIQMYGLNNDTQRGREDTTENGITSAWGPEHFGGKRVVKLVSGGARWGGDFNYHFIALDEDGEAWTWGSNDNGQCGIGPEETASGDPASNAGGSFVGGLTDVTEPVRLHSDEYFGGNKIVDVFAGGHDTGISFFLTENGRLYSCGYNVYGQLGYATDSGFLSVNRSRVPFDVGIDWSTYGGIQKLIIGGDQALTFVLVLDGQGIVWGWGYNLDDVLGKGSATNDANTIDLTALNNRFTGWAIAGDIVNMWVTGSNATSNVWYRTTDGRLYGQGDNSQYQLDTGNTTSPSEPTLTNDIRNVVKVVKSAEYATSIFALTEDKRIYSKPVGNDESGFGTAAGNLNNNYCMTQRSSTQQYGWKEVHIPNSCYKKIIDIQSVSWTFTLGGSAYSSAGIFFALTDDGRIIATQRSSHHDMTTGSSFSGYGTPGQLTYWGA